MPTQKAPAQKPRTAGRAWTEEEKDVVWEKVMHAKANDCRSLTPSAKPPRPCPTARSRRSCP